MARTKQTKRKRKHEEAGGAEGGGGAKGGGAEGGAKNAKTAEDKPRKELPTGSVAKKEVLRLKSFRTLNVSGLNSNTTEETLKKIFGDKVLEVTLCQQKREATIEFESEEAAEIAKEKRAGAEVDCCQLKLSFHHMKTVTISKTVKVHGLSRATTVESLKDKFGAVAVKFHYFDKHKTRPTGNGSCVFDTREDAQKAINAFHNTTLDGKNITMRFTKDELEDWQCGIAVVVGNLSSESTEEGLKDKFVGCTHTQLVNHYRNKKLKVAIISYENREEALKAVETHNGTEYAGSVLTVVLKIRKKRNKKKKGKNGQGPNGDQVE